MDHQQKDETAVAYLATAMNTKLARARAKGRSGWDTPECTQQHLSDLLREHVEKGDPVDVANFCAFLAARGEGIAPRQCLAQIEEPAGAAPAAVAPEGVVAWMTPEGDRVVTTETMDGARKDGGAMLSSMRPYTVALVRAGAPAAVAGPVIKWPDTCDGLEQEAFEAWAKRERHDMQQHPLHYLFLDEKTDAARQGWKAGLLYAVAQMKIQAAPALEAPAVEERNSIGDLQAAGAAIRAALAAAPQAPAAPAVGPSAELADYQGPDDTPHPVLVALSEHDSPCDDTAEAIARIAALRAEIKHLRPFLLRAQAHQEAETDRLAECLARPSATTLNVLRVALERGNMPYRATGFKDHEIATAAEWVRAAQAAAKGEHGNG